MKTAFRIAMPVVVLLGLPAAGIRLAGRDLSVYLEFPPRTQYVAHAPFSWPVFIALAIVILLVILPFLVRVFRANLPGSRISSTAPNPFDAVEIRDRRFPWWGWLAAVLGIIAWVLAWTRFEWFEPLQLYTFSPLWFSYIAVINAVTYRRTGRCLMTHETRFFLGLFILSAAFWWFFEYLNRFVQNWYYVGCSQFSPGQYFIMATLPFSTVLPAVLSTEEWLAGYPCCSAGLEQFFPLRIGWSGSMTGGILFVAGAGLLLIGILPNQLYPLLWVAPMLLIAAVRHLTHGPALFPELRQGDWRRVYRFALAALICGFLWEMWNWASLAKWIYTIPYVHRFTLFEMPVLGYAGYLPFGLECAICAEFLRRSAGTLHTP